MSTQEMQDVLYLMKETTDIRNNSSSRGLERYQIRQTESMVIKWITIK